MPVIKIHELPYKESINDTDIMVIEDTQDTKQVTLTDLKLFLSSDEKLNAIMREIESFKDEMTDTLNSAVRNMQADNDAVEAKIVNLFNDHELTKKRLGNMIERFLDALKRLSDIEEDNATMHIEFEDLSNLVVTFDTRITDLENDNASNKNRLDALEAIMHKNDDDIENIKNTIAAMDNRITNSVADLNTKIDNMSRSNKEYAHGLYDDIMRYIDYYHHIRTNPPNFDEPYKGDPEVAAYVHPIGTIFETSDKNFEINKWFPGVWKFLGNQNSWDEDDECVVDRYTWERIE